MKESEFNNRLCSPFIHSVSDGRSRHGNWRRKIWKMRNRF